MHKGSVLETPVELWKVVQDYWEVKNQPPEGAPKTYSFPNTD